jgi:hypothetical protein
MSLVGSAWTLITLQIGFCTAILLAAVYWPPLAEPLHLVAPSRTDWVVILGLSLAPLIPIQLGMMIAAAFWSHQANKRREASPSRSIRSSGQGAHERVTAARQKARPMRHAIEPRPDLQAARRLHRMA